MKSIRTLKLQQQSQFEELGLKRKVSVENKFPLKVKCGNGMMIILSVGFSSQK